MHPLTQPWKCLGRSDAEGFMKDLRRDIDLEIIGYNVESERARRPLVEKNRASPRSRAISPQRRTIVYAITVTASITSQRFTCFVRTSSSPRPRRAFLMSRIHPSISSRRVVRDDFFRCARYVRHHA